jgi:DNA-binding NarL/FixJ family response regulator
MLFRLVPVGIRVVIADDQAMVRDGLRRILGAAGDIEVVGEAADGVEALELVRALRPDVALVDIRMPRMDGLTLTRELAGGPTRVVVVTTFDLDEYVYAALRGGAAGFLLKRSGPALLAEAVRAAVSGESLISPAITVKLLRHLAGPRPESPQPLTERELEIAAHVGAGRTNAEIGAELFISPGTVKTHVAAVQRKLAVRNRVGIAVWAWNNGVVAP